MWKRKTTPEDIAYIVEHSEMSAKALSEKVGVSVRTVHLIRSIKTFQVCEGRPQTCFDCPFPDCRLDGKASLAEDEYKFIEQEWRAQNMIKIENTEVVGWKHAIRGMRNPMNSWDKSDSEYGCECGKCEVGDDECLNWYECHGAFAEYIVGENDLALMQKLVKAGTDHRKFMRMIVVYCDIVAPMYWWKEFDTYKVGTVRNSCSTMHKITAKEVELDDFSHERLCKNGKNGLFKIINFLEVERTNFLLSQDKAYWYSLIQLLPSSYNQRSTVMLNYEVLANMYHSRKEHKLDEWREFCKWIETLPYSELITGKKPEMEV